MNIRKIKYGKHSKQFSTKNNSFRNRNKFLDLTINIASKLFLLFVFIFIYKVILKKILLLIIQVSIILIIMIIVIKIIIFRN